MNNITAHKIIRFNDMAEAIAFRTLTSGAYAIRGGIDGIKPWVSVPADFTI